MSVYSNPSELFSDLVEYNESNIEYMGGLQIPMTNIYYVIFLDPNDSKSNSFVQYLDDSEIPNPFANIGMKINANIDSEQVCNINLVTSSLQQINKDIVNTLENALESNSKIALVLDIDLLFNLITSFAEEDIEAHLYDFILNRLKNSVDKIFILDTKNILKNDNKLSCVYDELKLYLLKIKEKNKEIISDMDVTIYKYHDSLYWRILDLNQTIEYIDEDFEKDEKSDEEFVNDIKVAEIDNREAFLKTVKLSKVCFTNLFEKHSNVLHPLDKLKSTSIFE